MWKMEEPLTALVTRLGVEVGVVKVVKVVKGRPSWAVMGFVCPLCWFCALFVFPLLCSHSRIGLQDGRGTRPIDLTGMSWYGGSMQSVRAESAAGGEWCTAHSMDRRLHQDGLVHSILLIELKGLVRLLFTSIRQIHFAMYSYNSIHHKPQVHLKLCRSNGAG